MALESHIRGLWEDDHCYLRQCMDCGFGFADPFVAGDMTFYNLAYKRAHYPKDKWEYQRTLADLSQKCFRGQRVLEVGSGFGHFLDKIADTYVAKSGITALEFDDKSAAILRGKGYEVLQEDIRSGAIDTKFDAIFLFQVLEHLHDLDQLFDRLSFLLRDGGLLFVAVPNPMLIHFNENNGSLLDMPPNHIGLWSEHAFGRINLRHRLRLDKCEAEPFNLTSFIRLDIAWSYLRKSQESGTFANWSQSRLNASYGKQIRAVAALLNATRRISVWRKAASERNLGGSTWVRFTKTS
jgi:SAM-dependent methyltransferase